MPYNGSGVWSALSSPGAFNPAVTGQQATPVAWNAFLADLAASLSMVMTTDGQSTVTQDISLNGHQLTNVGTALVGTDAPNLTQVKALLYQVPVTKTADFALNPDTDLWVINNKAGSALIVTLPSAATYPGLELHFQNYQATAVSSASSNVRPIDGSPLGIAICSAIAGAWTTIVSDGTNWRRTQGGV